MGNLSQVIIGAGVTYQCPQCRGALDKGKDYWRCKQCGRQFGVRRGVPILDVNGEPAASPSGTGEANGADKPLWSSSPASGSITVPDADKFLDEVEHKGWRVALGNLWGPTSGALMRAVAPNRIAWKYLLDIDSSWKALDIGAGAGGMACQLAKECSVVALDKAWCDAAFMHLRGQQEGLTRFEAVAADATSLPFEASQFNLATMVGAFEWVPFNYPDRSPRDVHLQSLREVKRVLKPGGSFFLGIENGRYFGYFLGAPEPHTALNYISLMKRDEAGILSQDLRGKPFLEWTYSRDEYIELFKEAGFVNIQSFWLYPDYAFINYIVPLDKPNILSYFIKELLNVQSFGGSHAYAIYQMYRFLDPSLVRQHVQFFGFLARCPDRSRGQ